MTVTVTARQLRGADPLMTALFESRARIVAGLDYLRLHAGHPERVERGQKRLRGIVLRDYLPALRDLAASTDPRELHRRRMRIKARLARGWRMAASPRGDALFDELATQYAILTDALRVEHPDPARRTLPLLLDRIDAAARPHSRSEA
ncbi:MAG TPA: hypothetical protein PLR44_14250 [Thermomicrobiales bacterium]|nr:hypothetical protein [Chloroflexota bacterium]HQZ91210.1 hypothetical protein [Thermomicrobiales bacterium]HRA32897.1 hypothetical protein [Thermomicrobiales bacterium]